MLQITYHSIFIFFLIIATSLAALESKKISEPIQQSQKSVENIQYKYLIFTQQCYQTFFYLNDWLNFDCLKITATKFIGYGLVMGGAIIKFPQIIKIISLKSVLGISFISVILELSTNILATGYCLYKSNPFSLYGENVFIGFQMLIVILLFVLFGKGSKIIYSLSFGLMILAAYYISDPHHLPSFIVEHSIIVQTLLICTSRFSQILQTHRLKSTGSLALITYALTVLGNIARIATILVQASHDYKFLMSITLVTVLNAYILFQFYLYRTKNVVLKPEQKIQ